MKCMCGFCQLTLVSVPVKSRQFFVSNSDDTE
jgi:hypothetical protein